MPRVTAAPVRANPAFTSRRGDTMSGSGRGETGMPGQAPGRVLVPAAGREVASRREGGAGAVAVGALALGAFAAGALAVGKPAAGPFALGRTAPGVAGSARREAPG